MLKEKQMIVAYPFFANSFGDFDPKSPFSLGFNPPLLSWILNSKTRFYLKSIEEFGFFNFCIQKFNFEKCCF